MLIIGFAYGKGKFNQRRVGKLFYAMYKPSTMVTKADIRDTAKVYGPMKVVDIGGVPHSLALMGSCSGFDDGMCNEFTNAPAKYLFETVEVAHFGIFETGKLRHPQFERLRPDKNGLECIFGAGDHMVPEAEE